MKVGNIEMQEGTRFTNLTLPNGGAFPKNPALASIFFLTAPLTGYPVGIYKHDGTKWLPIATLHFSGTSLTPLATKIWIGTATVASGRWSVTLPTGLFSSVLNVQATAGTSGAAAANANNASVDLSATMSTTTITGTCTNAQNPGSLLGPLAAFSPNGTIVHVQVTGT